jgi:hypothetical protein
LRRPEHADRDAGGADDTATECADWMREAGFEQARAQHLIGPDSMFVGIK